MKKSTEKEYQKSINKVIDYINLNLSRNIDLEELANIANISKYHFHRVFTAFIGESVSAYINRLRIEKSAQYLQTTKMKIADIAFKTGYQSQFAYSKAFKKHFGISPSAFRNMKSFFSSNFSKIKNEYKKVKPKIIFREKTDLVYIRITAKYGKEEAYEKAWKKLWNFAKSENILNYNNEFIGISFDDPGITNNDKCRFYACVSCYKDFKANAEFGKISLDNGKYAVFELKGSYEGLNDLYNSIYYNYFPSSSYKIRNAMPFEKYINNPDLVSEDELITEVYVPVY